MLRRLLGAILIIIPTATAFAQWQNVAPGLLGTVPEYGHVAFKAGIVWAGLRELWMSPDTGKTWTKTGFPDRGHINYIEFFDRSTGIVATNSGAYLTRDQGTTWQTFSFSDACTSAGFGRTSNDLIYCEFSPAAIVRTSHDGGVNWTMTAGPGAAVMHRQLNDGTLAAFTISRNLGGAVELSNDFGGSWTTRAGKTKWDSFNFTTDPCDDDLFYVVNEEYYTQTDGYSQIYFSSNRGATWIARQPFQTPYYSAAIAATHNAFYAGTNTDGIRRSTDHGATWKGIGGPNGAPDTRGLCAVNDNILFAIDSFGGVWRTLNSGGDPITPTASAAGITLQNPFRNPTGALQGALCDEFDTIIWTGFVHCGDQTLRLLSATLSGSPNFSLISSQQLPRDLSDIDSIPIRFTSLSDTLETASLMLRLQFGGATIDTTLQLYGRGAASRIASSLGDGTLHAASGASLPIAVTVSLPAQFGIGSAKVSTIRYAIAYDTTLLYIDPATAMQAVRPRGNWVIQAVTVGNGLITIRESNPTIEQLSDSIYLGAVSFRITGIGPRSTAIHLASLSLSTDSTDVHFCIGAEGEFVATVAIAALSVASSQGAPTRFELYPDPVPSGEAYHARLVLDHSASVTIFTTDLLGRSTSPTQQLALTAGTHILLLPQQLVSGTYYLRIEADGVPVTQKFIVR